MPVFGIDRLRRRRERRISECSDRNRHHFRFAGRLPVHRRSATRTEAEGDRIPAIRCSSISLAISGHPDVFTRKEGGKPVGAACSPLALETMAQRDIVRIAGTARGKLPANACCNPWRHQILVPASRHVVPPRNSDINPNCSGAKKSLAGQAPPSKVWRAAAFGAGNMDPTRRRYRLQTMEQALQDELEVALWRNRRLREILERFEEIALPDSWVVAGSIAQTIWAWVADNLRSLASKASTSYISMTTICRSTPKSVMRVAAVIYFDAFP
jgi:hypothetical protein